MKVSLLGAVETLRPLINISKPSWFQNYFGSSSCKTRRELCTFSLLCMKSCTANIYHRKLSRGVFIFLPKNTSVWREDSSPEPCMQKLSVSALVHGGDTHPLCPAGPNPTCPSSALGREMQQSLVPHTTRLWAGGRAILCVLISHSDRALYV